MKAKASVIAQKLLNLYRQAHVIDGGWGAVNRVFMDEASADVMSELHDLPTGKMLVTHIENLRSGKTPINSIARELLPYGGMMAEEEPQTNLTHEELNNLLRAIDYFTPDTDGLTAFMGNPVVKQLGTNWITLIKNALADHPEALEKFDKIVQIFTAYKLWDAANNILSKPVTDRERAQLQVDMPEYETYLPMFGDDGTNLLHKLHELTSSMPQIDA